MLRLGHIDYSNCVPVHGRFLLCGPPPGVEMVPGVPGELNALLAAGAIDVAPASSIEYARHADRYRILPGLSISARHAVHTIQLVSRGRLESLQDGARVAVPTASATSVVLTKIVMAQWLGIRARYEWYDQAHEDPLGHGAAAALYIGDAAHRQASRTDVLSRDLALLWREWTGLPFVFALWQTSVGREAEDAVRRLAGEIVMSRAWSFRRLDELAARFEERFRWPAAELVEYWRSLDYGWDDELAGGLLEFYRRAAELGESPAVDKLVFLE